MSAFFRRVAAIPWREITGDAFSRAFLCVKALCVVHVVNEHVCSWSIAQGPSMLPTISPSGDVVAWDRVSVRLGRVGTGDVVLLLSPEDPSMLLAKRVRGVEGESVTYLVDPEDSGGASKTVVVPQGHVWVQGDNPFDSWDSRDFGPVPYGLIKGKVFCRVWPPERFGSLDSNPQELC